MDNSTQQISYLFKICFTENAQYAFRCAFSFTNCFKNVLHAHARTTSVSKSLKSSTVDFR